MTVSLWGGSPAVSPRLGPGLIPFNISIHKLAEDPGDVLLSHAADMELSGTANATDDRLRIHREGPPQAGVME